MTSSFLLLGTLPHELVHFLDSLVSRRPLKGYCILSVGPDSFQALDDRAYQCLSALVSGVCHGL